MPDGSPAQDDLPSGLSPVWVIVFLTVYWLLFTLQIVAWSDYSVQLFDTGFLLVVAAFLWRVGRGGEVRRYLVGRGWLYDNDRRWVWFCLVATAVAYVSFGRFWRVTPATLPRSFLLEVTWAPVVEEMIHRGVILTILLRNVSGHRFWAVLLSALIFAAAHWPASARNLAVLTTLGLIWGYTWSITRCLPLTMLCHALWNATRHCPIVNDWLKR